MKRNPELQSKLDKAFDLSGCLQRGTCVSCGNAVTDFKDALSAKEYSISGLCQSCQDEIFSEYAELLGDINNGVHLLAEQDIKGIKFLKNIIVLKTPEVEELYIYYPHLRECVYERKELHLHDIKIKTFTGINEEDWSAIVRGVKKYANQCGLYTEKEVVSVEAEYRIDYEELWLELYEFALGHNWKDVVKLMAEMEGAEE